MAKLGDDKAQARSKSTTKRGTSKPAPKKSNQDAQSGLNRTAVKRRSGPSTEENHEMAAPKGTKTITLGPDHEEPAAEFFGQRKKPESGQFRLQVDRQTKASYATREAAEEAGLAIKRTYPILQVVVHDAAEGVHKTIELPNP
jgi:hypothetical protein